MVTPYNQNMGHASKSDILSLHLSNSLFRRIFRSYFFEIEISYLNGKQNQSQGNSEMFVSHASQRVSRGKL